MSSFDNPHEPITIDDAHACGIAAIERARDLGFRFLHLRDKRGDLNGLYAEHWRFGAVDIFAVVDQRDAVVARYRTEDYECTRDPIWQVTGTVADVIAELLALPPHGSPGAPTRALRTSSSLWTPGRT